MKQEKKPLLNKDNWLGNGNRIRYIAMVKPYNLKELSILYGISKNTFMRWLLPFENLVGSKIGSYYTVLQVETIFFKLGLPYHIFEPTE